MKEFCGKITMRKIVRGNIQERKVNFFFFTKKSTQAGVDEGTKG